MTTPVIFRKWKKKSDQWERIIAVFPTIPTSDNSALCESYEHVGQHGGCNYYRAILPNTVPAKLEEYQELLQELKQRGYDDLVVYRRMQRRFIYEREAEVRIQKKAVEEISELESSFE